jgi:hypothetical protein
LTTETTKALFDWAKSEFPLYEVIFDEGISIDYIDIYKGGMLSLIQCNRQRGFYGFSPLQEEHPFTHQCEENFDEFQIDKLKEHVKKALHL